MIRGTLHTEWHLHRDPHRVELTRVVVDGVDVPLSRVRVVGLYRVEIDDEIEAEADGQISLFESEER